MNSTTTTAYSELTRVLPWSLRALGYSFPVSDRASHVLASAAALEPGILDGICRIAPRAGLSDGIDITTNRDYRIDAKHRSLLEIGPAAMDFMGARTPARGVLQGMIDNVTELEILPAVLLVGADYNLSSLAVVVGPDKSRWILQTTARGARVILRGRSLESLQTVLSSGRNDLLEAARKTFQSTASATSCSMFATRQFDINAENLPGVEIMDADAALARAFQFGIPIKAETLKAIYDLEKLTWAPTSERSRAQAGFQQAAGGAA